MKYYGGCDVGSTYTKAVILDENGKIDPDKLRPITFDPIHHTYRVLGEKVGNAFKDGAKLK